MLWTKEKVDFQCSEKSMKTILVFREAVPNNVTMIVSGLNSYLNAIRKRGKVMSIFNEIGLAIGKGTEGIGAKAKVIRESSKLSFMVGEEEKKLTNYYQRIGQIYADIHKNDYEPEFAELMSLVEEARNNLMDYRRQSEELKQSRNCPVCGRMVAGDGQFCSFCGSRIHVNTVSKSANVVSERICCGCGAILDKDAKFCEKCGLPVGETLEKAAEQVEDSSVGENSNITFAPETSKQGVSEQEISEPETSKQETFGQEISKQEIFEQNTIVKKQPEYVEPDQQDKSFSDTVQPLLCPVCGEQVEEGAAFCGNCGNRI